MKAFSSKKILIGILFLVFFSPAFLSAQITNSSDIDKAIQDFSQVSGGQKETILGAAGLPKASDFNVANMMASIIFSSIGFIAFVYGKKKSRWRPMLIGAALMGYTYLVSSIFLTYAAGIALTACLYFFRE